MTERRETPQSHLLAQFAPCNPCGSGPDVKSEVHYCQMSSWRPTAQPRNVITKIGFQELRKEHIIIFDQLSLEVWRRPGKDFSGVRVCVCVCGGGVLQGKLQGSKCSVNHTQSVLLPPWRAGVEGELNLKKAFQVRERISGACSVLLL